MFGLGGQEGSFTAKPQQPPDHYIGLQMILGKGGGNGSKMLRA